MQQLHHVALISQVSEVSFSQLAPVAAALSKQVARDFAPIWGITATVQAFPDLEHTPAGYYPIILQTEINEPGAAGYHTDEHNQPYALIQYDKDWTVTASHELLEMLGDPFGNTLIAGTVHGKRVQILKELCDPCEDFTYTINGVAVSDFLRPAWYEPTAKVESCSYLGKLTTPQQVAQNGYFSWLDPSTNHWYQITNFGKVEVQDLGTADEMEARIRKNVSGTLPMDFAKALRALIDKHTTLLRAGKIEGGA